MRTRDPDDDHPRGAGALDRRTVLRIGGAAVAGTGAAAVLPSLREPRAGATTVTAATTGAEDAFAGAIVQPRSLERWLFAHTNVRHVVCLGDSITKGLVGNVSYGSGGDGNWVERLTTVLGRWMGPNIGPGFRGLWLGVEAGEVGEWVASGTWTKTAAGAPYDVCPFGSGFRSNAGSAATLTWTKPGNVKVAGFDLYWFCMAGAGNWQYRVDGGAWRNMHQTLTPADNRLHKFYVALPVRSNVQIRAHDGSQPCLAPIGGIAVYADDPRSAKGSVVHNLGRDGAFLTMMTNGAADRLAFFDEVVSNPPTAGFEPALVVVMFSNDMTLDDTAAWSSELVTLVSRLRQYADVLLMNPYERGGTLSPTVQAAYRAATKTVAAANGCAVLDLYDAWAAAGDTGWAAANADGLMHDIAHPSQLGHEDISARLWRVLRTYS